MAGDGFLMNRCLNCGRYQHATGLGGFDFSWVRKQAARAWKQIKCRFTPRIEKQSKSIEGLNLSIESAGGMK